MKKCLLFPLILVFWGSFAQSIRLVTADDIPGIQVTRYDTFAGKDLSNYIGNRAFLFNEFGFRQMCVTEYTLQQEKARAEIYIMEDAPSAFGIYSVSASKCNIRNLYSTFSCITANQVSAALGPFYINVLNLNKDQGGQELCMQLLQATISKNPQETWYLPPLLQQQALGPYINTLKYIEGPIGLSAGAPVLTTYLENIPFKCFVLTINAPVGSGVLAGLLFPDDSSADNFMVQAGLDYSGGVTPTMSVDGTYQSWMKINDTKMVYLKSNSPDLKISDLMPEKLDFYNYR
jgi:hypothetical protein